MRYAEKSYFILTPRRRDFALDFSYLWLRRRYFRSEIQRKTSFSLVFPSLIRTFAINLRG